jgi:hypothetical protein
MVEVWMIHGSDTKFQRTLKGKDELYNFVYWTIVLEIFIEVVERIVGRAVIVLIAILVISAGRTNLSDHKFVTLDNPIFLRVDFAAGFNDVDHDVAAVSRIESVLLSRKNFPTFSLLILHNAYLEF